MWERQGARLPLASRWWFLGGGRPGARVADVGCGPGRIALAYADWAGPEGSVLAVDADPDALAFLEARRDPARHANVRALLLDAQDSPLPAERYDAIFVTNVLHHVERPGDLLRHLRPTRSTLVVAEFDPEGPGEIGPPPEERIAPARLAEWLREAGWAPDEPARMPAHESYAIVARSTPADPPRATAPRARSADEARP